MAIDLTAGLQPLQDTGGGAPGIDLSAGLVPARKSAIDLSAGLIPSRGSSAIDLSAGLVAARDPNDRFFGGGQGEVRAYEPTVWDRIRSLFGKPVEPGLNDSPLTQAIGAAIPQGSVPALVAAKRYAVDPLDRAAQTGGDFLREAGRDVVTGATLIQHGGDYLSATV
jgi:hypothetical protein